MAEIRTRVATPEYRKGWDAVFGKKRDPLKQYEAHLRRLTGKDIEARVKLLFGDWECGVTGVRSTRSTSR